MEIEKPTVERLDVDNYATWSIRMKALLISKGLWAAIEGDAGIEVRALDQKALACILLYVRDHHLMALASCDTAKSAWEMLKNVYEAKTNARKLLLRRELTMLKMGVSEPLTKYAARAKDIQLQLLATGESVTDTEAALQFLAGLPGAYDMIKTVLTASDSDLAIDTVLPKLMAVEQQMLRPEYSNGDEKALSAKRFNGRNGHGNRPNRHETRTFFFSGRGAQREQG